MMFNPIPASKLVMGSPEHELDRNIDGVDRDNSLNRLGNILTQTACFSWAGNSYQWVYSFRRIKI